MPWYSVSDGQTPNMGWDGHGSGGGTSSGEWETRTDPGDAVAFAIEQGGKLRVIGPLPTRAVRSRTWTTRVAPPLTAAAPAHPPLRPAQEASVAGSAPAPSASRAPGALEQGMRTRSWQPIVGPPQPTSCGHGRQTRRAREPSRPWHGGSQLTSPTTWHGGGADWSLGSGGS